MINLQTMFNELVVEKTYVISRVNITSHCQRQPPKMFDCASTTYYSTDVKSRYRHVHYRVIDLMNIQLKERYDVEHHDGLIQYKMMEDALLEGHPYAGLKVYPEISHANLVIHLPMFRHSYNYIVRSICML